MKMKYADKDKGFSLIELIIAIAILVILTGLLAPQFMKYIEKARKAKCMNNIEVVKTEYQFRQIDVDEEVKLDDVLKEIEPKCPSGGRYSVVEIDEGWFDIECSKHGRGDGEALSSNQMVTIAKNVFDSMYSFIGKSKSDIEAELKNFNPKKGWISNDNLRAYLLKNVYNNQWPTFNTDVFEKSNFDQTLYVQPYMDFSKNGWEEREKSNVTVYASNSANDTTGERWKAYYIFYEGAWYQAPDAKKESLINMVDQSQDDIKKAMSEKGWLKMAEK